VDLKLNVVGIAERDHYPVRPDIDRLRVFDARGFEMSSPIIDVATPGHLKGEMIEAGAELVTSGPTPIARCASKNPRTTPDSCSSTITPTAPVRWSPRREKTTTLNRPGFADCSGL
jgi:hypothetical protein